MVKLKTFHWFLFLAILFLPLIFLAHSETTLDINVHDTYFVIAHAHLYGLLAVFFFTIFTLYWSMDKVKIETFKILVKIHVYGTLASLIGIFFPYDLVIDTSRFTLYDGLQDVNLYLSLCGLLFLLLQILFIINIFASVIRKLVRLKR